MEFGRQMDYSISRWKNMHNSGELKRSKYCNEGIETDEGICRPANPVGERSQRQEKRHELHALCGDHQFLQNQKNNNYGQVEVQYFPNTIDCIAKVDVSILVRSLLIK